MLAITAAAMLSAAGHPAAAWQEATSLCAPLCVQKWWWTGSRQSW